MIEFPEFAECASCAVKPGSPFLCQACLHNRATINALRAERAALIKIYVIAARLRTFPIPFNDHFELAGEVDACRSVLESPNGSPVSMLDDDDNDDDDDKDFL